MSEERARGTDAPGAGEAPEEEAAEESADEAAERAPGEAAGQDAEEGVDDARVEADLDALLEDARRERDEYLQLAQRARADFENYRKRTAQETSDAERRGRAALANELLPAIDNLERALVAAGVRPASTDAAATGEESPSQEVSAAEALAQGVALVYDELCAALGRAGVESFDPLGERFDPSLHEAISTRPALEGEEAGAVCETLQRGYRIEEQILRPARVVVSDAAPGGSGEGSASG